MRQQRLCGDIWVRCSMRDQRSTPSLCFCGQFQITRRPGLIHDQTLYLQKDHESQKDYKDNIPFQTILDHQTTLNLLLTSHAIHEEVHSIVYSTNTFYVKYVWTGLAPIRHLAPKVLATMAKLVMVMNQTSCDSSGCYSLETKPQSLLLACLKPNVLSLNGMLLPSIFQHISRHPN
jgi:hypothetical protein